MNKLMKILQVCPFVSMGSFISLCVYFTGPIDPFVLIMMELACAVPIVIGLICMWIHVEISERQMKNEKLKKNPT